MRPRRCSYCRIYRTMPWVWHYWYRCPSELPGRNWRTPCPLIMDRRVDWQTTAESSIRQYGNQGRTRTGAVTAGSEQHAGMPIPHDIIRRPQQPWRMESTFMTPVWWNIWGPQNQLAFSAGRRNTGWNTWAGIGRWQQRSGYTTMLASLWPMYRSCLSLWQVWTGRRRKLCAQYMPGNLSRPTRFILWHRGAEFVVRHTTWPQWACGALPVLRYFLDPSRSPPATPAWPARTVFQMPRSDELTTSRAVWEM